MTLPDRMDFVHFSQIDTTDEMLCLAHITDGFLLSRVSSYATAGACQVCQQNDLLGSGMAVNLALVAEIVDESAGRHYNHEGQLFDEQQVLESKTTDEVVETLLDGCITSDVFDRVCKSVAQLIREERDWFEPYDMDHEAIVEFEWQDFEQSVKHQSRLLSAPRGPKALTAPEQNYEFVHSLLVFAADHAGLIKPLSRGTKLYRARTTRDARGLERVAKEEPQKQLGPAPEERASDGRMNARGVPMFYAALDVGTACAEVALHSPYDEVVAGTFIVQQELHVLDLTQSLPLRSVFDNSPPQEGDHRLSSLGYYVKRITQPVILDGNHPVDYAPTQILTDAFRYWTNPPLDGIIYPSIVSDLGKNIVLFFGNGRWFEQTGKSVSRFERFQRHNERGTSAPLFVIDPKTVRRYDVSRNINVRRSKN